MKKYIILISFALIFVSCSERDEILVSGPDIDKIVHMSNGLLENEGMIQLGRKLENPYSVENMRKAYRNLADNGIKPSNATKSELDATHLYVRFLPKDFVELEILKRDATITLFDFPLDYEIEGEQGTYYHDPSLPDTAITWQYCAVPKDYLFPDVEYEILEELFLPEAMSDDMDGKGTEEWTFWDDLEVEALRLTGNLDEDYAGEPSKGRTKFHPQGTIKIVDNSGLDTIGLEGLYVIARSWFTTKHSYTDSNGDFYISSSFKGHCNYWIKWEREDYDIRSGNWGQAYYNGPRSDGDWNLTITNGGLSWCYGHIHRAAYIYYYYPLIYGIQSPPRQGGILNQRLHIGLMDKEGRGHYFEFNRFFTSPQIKVYSKTDYGSYRSSANLFGTTIHELAHASHWELGYSTFQYAVDYIFSKALVPESWASCVEHVITSDIYKNSSINTVRSWNDMQNKKLEEIEDGYTPIFIDCIDTLNQSEGKGTDSLKYPIDRVSGYTLGQLENSLRSTYFDIGLTTISTTVFESFALSTIKKKLKNNYENPTGVYLDELFSNYQ